MLLQEPVGLESVESSDHMFLVGVFYRVTNRKEIKKKASLCEGTNITAINLWQR